MRENLFQEEPAAARASTESCGMKSCTKTSCGRITDKPESMRRLELYCIRTSRSARRQCPEKSCCGRSPAANSPRFLPTNGQTGMYGSPIHRHLCVSPKSTSITRASPQCHDFRCNQHTAVAWKFAHVAYILVASGIGGRVHLMGILAQHCAHGAADRPRRVTLK